MLPALCYRIRHHDVVQQLGKTGDGGIDAISAGINPSSRPGASIISPPYGVGNARTDPDEKTLS
jgi:hypothetical protein